MNLKSLNKNVIDFNFILITLISLNFYLLYTLKVGIFDQIINLMISFGVFYYYKNFEIEKESQLGTFQYFFSFLLITIVLYRSFWLHSGDNFIFCFFSLLLIASVVMFRSFGNIKRELKPIFISLIMPLSKFLFIPLSIVVSPIATFFTWIFLNTFGFISVMDGQEIFYNNSSISVTFSCSGAGQIIFCFSAMIILNTFFPLKDLKLFAVQLCLSFLFTFLINILRLFILTLYAHTANHEGFSLFDYFHGGSGGLLFSLISMIISCESYKRFYYANS